MIAQFITRKLDKAARKALNLARKQYGVGSDSAALRKMLEDFDRLTKSERQFRLAYYELAQRIRTTTAMVEEVERARKAATLHTSELRGSVVRYLPGEAQYLTRGTVD